MEKRSRLSYSRISLLTICAAKGASRTERSC